jgi:translocation and assembly module TamB
LLLLVGLFFFVRSPWGQDIIIQKAATYVSKKTGTHVSIDKLFITFGGNIYLNGLYLEDTEGDTLIYSQNLETGIAVIPLIRKGEINISKIDWDGLVANVEVDSVSGDFNFDFLIDAFVTADTTAVTDSVAPFPDLSLGPIALRNIRLKYDDRATGMKIAASWDELQIDSDKFDLNKMDLMFDKILISGADITYLQSHAFPTPAETDTLTSTPSILLVLEKVLIQKSNITYISVPDGIEAQMAIGEFSLSLPEANLELQKILLKSVNLSDSKIDLKLTTVAGTLPPIETTDTTPFSWPEWWVEVGMIALENNEINYSSDGGKIQNGVFNPEAISLTGLNFEIHSLLLKDQKAKVVIDEISFKEGSGLIVENFTTKILVDESGFRFENFDARTSQSALKGDFLVSYRGLDNFINYPAESNFDIKLQNLETDASEALYFVPELADDSYFREVRKNGIAASGNISGNMDNLLIPRFDLTYGQNTSMKIRSAKVKNPTNLEIAYIDLEEFIFEIQGPVLESFLTPGVYHLPDNIKLSAKAKGSMNDFITDLALLTSDGNVIFDGTIRDEGRYFVKSTLEVQELDLGKILTMPDLDPVSLVTEINGSGSDLYNLEGVMEVDIRQLIWADMDFSELEFEIVAKDTVATLQAGLAKEFLDFNLNSTVRLDTVSPELNFFLDVKNLNTQILGATRQNIDTRFQVAGNMKGMPDDLSAGIEIRDGTFNLDGRNFPIGLIKVDARLSDQQTDVKIDSDFLEGFFEVNSSVAILSQSMEQYFNKLIVGESEITLQDVDAKSKFRFHPTPFIDQLLIADLDEMDTMQLEFGFNSSAQEIHAKIRIDHLLYLNANLDTFLMNLNGNSETLNFDMGFEKLTYDPLNMGRSLIQADFKDQKVNFAFNSQYEEDTLINFGSQFSNYGDTIEFQFKEKDLIFNKEKWEISPDNILVFGPKSLQFQNFAFTNGDQSFGVKNDFPGLEEDHVGIDFDNFNLHTILSFLNPENPIAKGIVNGNLITVTPFDAIGFLADLKIREFEVVEIPLGVLDLQAKASSLKEYDFSLALKEGEVDMDIYGAIMADSAGMNLDLDVDLTALQMSILETLSDSALLEAKGFITGNFVINGSVQEPIYQGNIAFKEAGFLVSQLNSSFTFPDELIELDNENVLFNNFTIKDALGSDFVIDGRIITENLADVGLDLKLKTQGFQIMNSTRADSDLFYGKASVDLDLTVGGTATLPEVTMQLEVNEGTEVSFIVPEDQVDLVERTGVVIFVNHEDIYDLIYKREGEITTRGIKGYDVKANLKIDPKTVFNLIVDERSNDNLRIQGEGDLNMLMNPNGDISLSGRYEVNSGHYEMNLFGLVNRRFELAPGSTVIWRGDPMDASLDFTAIYNIRTSAAELMQAQLSGIDNDTRGQFRQVLPFMVYLNIEGELLKPEISFELDLAEQERGAFGGSVYGMIQQINDQEDELAKQVFSLLVLNQFFPVVGNDGSGGGSVNLARSSVSQVLSSQLNALSGRLFGDSGFSMDFDLDSYTDFQTGTGQDRTQLNVAAKQTLMDDRLLISVGGQMDVEGGNQEVNQGDALFGDVSVEYRLDQRGQWRAKAYRKNQFESVIDGQLVVTGISIIFNKEFNAFKELWRKSSLEAVKEEDSENAVGTDEQKENEKKP